MKEVKRIWRRKKCTYPEENENVTGEKNRKANKINKNIYIQQRGKK